MDIKLKTLKVHNINKNYIRWFSDRDVVKYSENQYRKITLLKEKKYIQDCLKNKNLNLYGIFYKKKHIGNVSLVGLTSPSKSCEVTYMIGDKSFWNKGIATQVIRIIVSIAKKNINLTNYLLEQQKKI